jgi:hypothetical protein
LGISITLLSQLLIAGKINILCLQQRAGKSQEY